MKKLIVIKEKNKYGFADERTLRKVIPCKYDYAFDFEGNHAIVEKNNKWGLINEEGKEVIQCVYDLVYRFKNYYIIEEEGKLGISDKEGKVVVPCDYTEDEIKQFLEDRKKLMKNRNEEIENA